MGMAMALEYVRWVGVCEERVGFGGGWGWKSEEGCNVGFRLMVRVDVT